MIKIRASRTPGSIRMDVDIITFFIFRLDVDGLYLHFDAKTVKSIFF